MAFTQTDLDNIDKAIASGAKRVRFQDREVEYNSTAGMLKARAYIYNLINPIATRITRVFTSKGL